MPTKLTLTVMRSLSSVPKNKMELNQSTLVLTQILFRHGHRSPDQKLNYPGDPHKNELYLPFGHGELTLIGRKQCFAFGETLRTRYGNFLGSDYVKGIVKARSSAMSRARTTVQLVLAGLFPPTNTTKIHEQLNWQPIPFSYKPLDQDDLIAKAVLNMYNHEDHPEFRQTTNSQEVINCIEEELNWKVKKHAQCLLILDTLKAQIDSGLEMPKWCSKIYPDKLQHEFNTFAEHNFGRKTFVRHGIGYLMKEITDVMSQKVGVSKNNAGTPKIYLYSGHDVNIAAVLSVFKAFDSTKWPNYMSNITFELHKVDGQYFVRLLYQNGPDNARTFKTEEPITVIQLPSVEDNICSLNEFTDYVKEYFPDSPNL